MGNLVIILQLQDMLVDAFCIKFTGKNYPYMEILVQNIFKMEEALGSY